MQRRRVRSGPRRRASRGIAIALSMSLIVVACGGGSSDTKTSERNSGKRRSTTQASDPTDACKFIVAGTEKRTTPAPGDGVPYLVSAVAEPTTCYDKVSFVFDEGDSSGLPPGYTVEYRKKPFDLPPEISTTTAGFKDANFVLYVEITPAATEDLRNPRRSVDTYLGNLRLALKKMQHVTIVEWVDKLPDLTPEDQTDQKVVWLIGLDEKRPFTVDFANQPPRVNVLIMN
jgi:hypothetical protein